MRSPGRGRSGRAFSRAMVVRLTTNVSAEVNAAGYRAPMFGAITSWFGPETAPFRTPGTFQGDCAGG
eukprot:5413002-Lingulodinium_polyedra.AAC.1